MNTPPDNGVPQWPDPTYPPGYPPGPVPPQYPPQYPPTAAYPPPPPYYPPPPGPTLPASGTLPPPPPSPVVPQYSQPVYGQLAYAPPVDPGGGAAIAALVLGIIGIPMMALSFCDLPIVVAGIICGVVGMQRSTQRRGLAIAGLVLSLIPLVIGILVGIIALIASAQPHG